MHLTATAAAELPPDAPAAQGNLVLHRDIKPANILVHADPALLSPGTTFQDFTREDVLAFFTRYLLCDFNVMKVGWPLPGASGGGVRLPARSV